MQDLLEAVRRACSPIIWSRGVELSRGSSIVSDFTSGPEVVLQIATRGGMISPTVTLWLEDQDWSCDCPGREEVCAHVVAAVITLHRTRQEGTARPQHEAGRLRYCFTRSKGGLLFERVVVQGDTVEVLETTLAATARRGEGRSLIATQADHSVERALSIRRRGWLPPEAMPMLLAALARCPDVQLDGAPIKTAAAPVRPLQGYVVDVSPADGFRLQVERTPGITAVFSNGVALYKETLRPLGDHGLTAREIADFSDGRSFVGDEVAELVTEILPSLQKRLPVEIRTRKLPQAVTETPRLVLETHREGEALTVLPTLVYGQPPLARVDAGRLTLLRAGSVLKRQEAAEQQLVRHLHRALGLIPGHKAQFTGPEAVRFAVRLKQWSGEIRGHGHETFVLTAPLVPHWHLTPTGFDVWFEAAGAAAKASRASVHRVSATEVLRTWQGGESLLSLAGDGWAPLPLDWLQHHGQRVADLLAARDAAGALPRNALPDLARLCDALERPRPPEFTRLQTLLEDFHGLPEVPLPQDLQATLRPYQQRGVNWLVFLRQAGLGAMLADDMGLGKTLQALCALQGRTLVVAPTSVVYHWADEIRRFRPGLRLAIYHGPQRQLDPGADVTLTTYALLRLDATRLAEPAWDTVILDEAQNIKNPDSQVAQAAYRLRAAFRLTLSGTPVENRLDELWSQVHFLNRGLLGGRHDFQERYAKPIANGRVDVAARLRERLRPFILRRRKQEVVPELPPRTDVVLPCVLSEEERAVYDTIRAATLADVVARLEAGGSVLAAFEALLRLRQACCHPGLIPGQEATASAKVTLLLECLETASADGHKALVFSQWTTLLDLLEPHLRAAQMPYVRLDGTTRDRAGVVRRFQDEAGPPIMLVSLRAGGTGLNLTAADHVFLLDPWWNPAVEEQAADRAHRIGQTRPVLVYRLVAQETVEERILLLQERKRDLVVAALEGTDRATTMTREDVLALLA